MPYAASCERSLQRDGMEKRLPGEHPFRLLPYLCDGRRFVRFYEEYALRNSCMELRLDTNARNKAARDMYGKLGYEEIAVVHAVLNGIPDAELVLLEQHLS